MLSAVISDFLLKRCLYRRALCVDHRFGRYRSRLLCDIHGTVWDDEHNHNPEE